MSKALQILKACRERGQKRAGGIDLDEAIAELEEAMEPKSCITCLHLEDIGKSFKSCIEIGINIGHLTWDDFCCNKYEPKDNHVESN